MHSLFASQLFTVQWGWWCLHRRISLSFLSLFIFRLINVARIVCLVIAFPISNNWSEYLASIWQAWPGQNESEFPCYEAFVVQMVWIINVSVWNSVPFPPENYLTSFGVPPFCVTSVLSPGSSSIAIRVILTLTPIQIDPQCRMPCIRVLSMHNNNNNNNNNTWCPMMFAGFYMDRDRHPTSV